MSSRLEDVPWWRSARAYGTFLAVLGCLSVAPDSLFIRLAEVEQGGVCGTFYKYTAKGVVVTFGLICYFGGPQAFIAECGKLGRYFFILAACEGVQCLTWNLAILTTAVANGMVFILVTPAWCLMWTSLLTDRSTPRYTVVASCIALGWAVIIFIQSRYSTRGVESLFGDLIAIFCGMDYGLYLTLAAEAQRKYPDANCLVVFTLGSAVSVLGCYFMIDGDVLQDCYPRSGVPGYSWSFMDGILTLTAIGCISISTKYCPAVVAGLACIVEAITEPYVVWFVLGETPLRSTVVLGAVLCITLVVHEVVAHLYPSEKCSHVT
mmetsp:Transcript_30719/g.56140  ORF Transcript_30719/g.56140 Transcript_30719/m.56140 type:complete len:321 (+) Transcript_30719:98-1060(+)